MKMEITNETKTLLDKILPLFQSAERGDIVPYESIEEAAGILRHDEKWKAVMRHVKRWMRDHRSVYVMYWYRTGYLVATHEQAAKIGTERSLRRSYRELNRLVKRKAIIDDSVLGNHDRLAFHRSIEQATFARKLARAGVKSIVQKTEAHPRRQVVA